MPRAILYPEWRAENGSRRYPFADDATLTNGTDVLDVGLFVDAHLYPIGGNTQQYLSKITVEAGSVTFTVSDQDVELCTGSVDPMAGTGTIEMTDSYGRPAGVLLVDTEQLSFLTAWTLGDHTFKPAETRFAVTVVHPLPEAGVRGLLVDDVLFAGDVWIVGGEGVVFSPTDETGVIRMDVAGDPYYKHRRCENVSQEHTEAQRFLRTISNLLPNAVGNIGVFPGCNIAEDNVIRAVPVTGGLRLEFVGTRLGTVYVRD